MKHLFFRTYFLFLGCLVMLYACTGGFQNNDEPVNTIYLGSTQPIRQPTLIETIQLTPFFGTTSLIQVSQGIGDGISITEQNVDAHYWDIAVPFSSGEYLVYQILNVTDGKDLNYEIWIRSLESGDSQKLVECLSCPFVISKLETDVASDGSWKIIATAAGMERGSESILLFDLFQQKTWMVTCQADNPENYCNISLFSGHLLVYGENYPFFNVELSPSEWITVSGDAFNPQEWNYQFSPGGEVFFSPNQCAENKVLRIVFDNDSYEIEELPQPENLCQLSHSLAIFGKPSISSNNVAYIGNTSSDLLVWFSFLDHKNMAWVYAPDDSIIICKTKLLPAENTEQCYKVFESLDMVLPYNINRNYRVSWLDDSRFVWEKPSGISDGQIIGTMDLYGNVQILYEGDSITYQISPDGKWLLFEINNRYGLLNTLDATTTYLPLPDNASDATWLMIP